MPTCAQEHPTSSPAGQMHLPLPNLAFPHKHSQSVANTPLGSFPYPSHPSAGGMERVLPRGALPLGAVVPGAVTQQTDEWLWQWAPVGCRAGTHEEQAFTVVPSFVAHH